MGNYKFLSCSVYLLQYILCETHLSLYAYDVVDADRGTHWIFDPGIIEANSNSARSTRNADPNTDDEDQAGSGLSPDSECNINRNCNYPFQFCDHEENPSIIHKNGKTGKCRCMPGRKLDKGKYKCVCTEDGRKDKLSACRPLPPKDSTTVCDRLDCQNNQKCTKFETQQSSGYYCDCEPFSDTPEQDYFYGDRCQLRIPTSSEWPDSTSTTKTESPTTTSKPFETTESSDPDDNERIDYLKNPLSWLSVIAIALLVALFFLCHLRNRRSTNNTSSIPGIQTTSLVTSQAQQ